jgi:hypothetical protein
VAFLNAEEARVNSSIDAAGAQAENGRAAMPENARKLIAGFGVRR